LCPEHLQPVSRADGAAVAIISRRSDGQWILSHRCLDHLDRISMAPPKWECLRCGRHLFSVDLEEPDRH
jgi:hypothetical protein